MREVCEPCCKQATAVLVHHRKPNSVLLKQRVMGSCQCDDTLQWLRAHNKIIWSTVIYCLSFCLLCSWFTNCVQFPMQKYTWYLDILARVTTCITWSFSFKMYFGESNRDSPSTTVLFCFYYNQNLASSHLGGPHLGC